MTAKPERLSGSALVGILLIIIGGLFLMETLDIMNIGPLFANWWPLILIVVGLLKLKGCDKTGGAIVLLVGVAFLSATLGIINWGSIFRLWPLILVAVGLSIIMKARGRTWWGMTSPGATSEDFIKSSVIFGGLNRTVTSENFKGGDVTAIFGGVELDFRQAKPSPEGCQLNITALFGGVEITVPQDWQLAVSGTPIFGAIENKTTWTGSEKEGKTVHCRCTAAFGGIELRN